MKKVLLLNPPGRKLYIRDYFCSKVSQADYIPHPLDLVILSGIIAEEYEVELLDAMVSRMPEAAALASARAAEPFAIISMFGAASFGEDLGFARKLREALPSVKLIGIGDVFREGGEVHVSEGSPLDALLLDFTTRDILSYLRADYGAVMNMVFRDRGSAVKTPVGGRGRQFGIPVPKHELFRKYDYRYPFVRKKKFATTIIDYGCPFDCSFCVIGKLGYKFRRPDNVMPELRRIRELGISEVFFHTQTFGAHRASAEELCGRMIEEKLGLGWVCFSRVDVTDPKLLDLMKRAGCHTIIYGVESGSEEILRKYHKGYSVKDVVSTVDYARSVGIRTAGTFILGLPEETGKTAEATIALIKRINLDFASFNVAVPRSGTELRTKAIGLGFVDDKIRVMDQSGSEIAMPTSALTRNEVLAFRRRAVAAFYLRPGYILRRLLSVRSFHDIGNYVRQAFSLIKNTWIN